MGGRSAAESSQGYPRIKEERQAVVASMRGAVSVPEEGWACHFQGHLPEQQSKVDR